MGRDWLWRIFDSGRLIFGAIGWWTKNKAEELGAQIEQSANATGESCTKAQACCAAVSAMSSGKGGEATPAVQQLQQTCVGVSEAAARNDAQGYQQCAGVVIALKFAAGLQSVELPAECN